MKNVFATLLFSLALLLLLISVSNATILTIRPNAAGTNSAWTGTPLDTYEDVDEGTQNGDTDYYSVVETLFEQSFNLVNPAETGNITNVKVVAWASQTGDENLILQLVIGGTSYDGTLTLPTSSYTEHTDNWATNPNTVANWTWTDIDSLEAGIKPQKTANWTGEMRVTQIYVEVTYAPNNSPNAPITPECDGKASPAITTETTPVFTWVFSDQDGGDAQSAYGILVSTSSTSLDSNTGEMWDTLKYVSTDSSAAYGGSALTEDTSYYWKVRTWDAGDSSGPYCGTQVFFLQAPPPNNNPFSPITPECDGKASPAITTETAPVFTWVFSDQDGGDLQSAYAVLVSTSSTSLDSNTGEMWDTLKYVSTDSSAAYGGSALSEDTSYYWKVRTWDAGDSSGPYCGTQVFFLQATGPVVPTGLVATASTEHTISLSWQSDENARYAIEKSSNDIDFSMIEQWSDNITNNAYTAMNLKAGSSYWFKVYGYNQSEVMSGPSTPAVKMTKSVAVIISSSAYTKCGNVNDCEVIISSGTFSEDSYVEINTNPTGNDSITKANNKLEAFHGLQDSTVDINAYNLYGSKMEINDFQNSIYLRIYYNITEVDNAGIDEQSLRIYTLNDEREQWVKVGGVHNVNETGHFVEVPVEHFSVFSLVGGGESLELVNMANYPNPFSDETVFIFEITKRADIKLQIFTTSGRLLMTFEEPDMDPGYNTIPDTGGGWNGTDVNGSSIASGLYFWRLTATPEGGTPVNGTGKLTIIR